MDGPGVAAFLPGIVENGHSCSCSSTSSAAAAEEDEEPDDLDEPVMTECKSESQEQPAAEDGLLSSSEMRRGELGSLVRKALQLELVAWSEGGSLREAIRLDLETLGEMLREQLLQPSGDTTLSGSCGSSSPWRSPLQTPPPSANETEKSVATRPALAPPPPSHAPPELPSLRPTTTTSGVEEPKNKLMLPTLPRDEEAEAAEKASFTPIVAQSFCLRPGLRQNKVESEKIQIPSRGSRLARFSLHSRLSVNSWCHRGRPRESSTSPQQVWDCGGQRDSCKSSSSASAAQGEAKTPSSMSRCFSQSTIVMIRRQQKRLKDVVESSWFDTFMCCCIVLNALSIGWQCNHMVTRLDEDTPTMLKVVEQIFSVVFTVELAFRIAARGKKFLLDADWRWNLFDLFIVLLVIGEEVSKVVLVTGAVASSNFSFMRVMRILRLVRIVRIVRLLRFVQELRTMVCSIVSSLRSLCWTLVLLLLLMYVLGVYITQVVADSGHERPEILHESKDLWRFYGSLPRSVLSLFQAMTGGVDWDDLMQPLSKQISPWMALIFSMYIAFAMLALMNVVTGVFVESALATAREDREIDVMSQVRRLFDMVDRDNSGTVSWDEFAAALQDESKAKLFKVMDIDPTEARGLFVLLDTNDSGEVAVEEFMQGCLRLRGHARAIDLATMQYFNKRMVMWWKERFAYMQEGMDNMERMLETLALPKKGGSSSSSSVAQQQSSRRQKRAASEVSGQIWATWSEIKAEGALMASKFQRSHKAVTEDALMRMKVPQKSFSTNL